MTNQSAEEKLDTENETMQNVEFKKNKPVPNYYLKTLRSDRTNIMMHTVFIVLIIGTSCYCQTNGLFNVIPNLTKQISAEPKSYNSNCLKKNINKFRETVLDLEEKTTNIMNHIRLLMGTIQVLRTRMMQNGSYINAKQAQQVLQTALESHVSDKLGLADFALLYTGGTILNIPQTDPAPVIQYKILGFTVYTIYSEPTEMLEPDMKPGKCFAFLGDFGRIQIRLSQKIVIYGVSMEYAHQAFTGEEMISAPKFFTVFGFQGPLDDNLIQLGTFQYSIYGPARQTFIISEQRRMAFQFVELRILSNHDQEEMTCVYRFRIHGIP